MTKTQKTSIIFFLLIALLCSCCSSCDSTDDPAVSANNSLEFQVIFFDIENSSDGSVHYYGTNQNEPYQKKSITPADCYMIKSGNVEILVDAGFQLNSNLSYIANIYKENVIKKIEKFCTDGVLDYLIVTHGDYDHIIGLAIDGGLLDYFYNSDKKIGKIIDFDSDLVVALSDPEKDIIKGKGLFFDYKTNIEKYRQKRDKLLEKGTRHIPAAEFFKGKDFLKDNTLVNAMPDAYLKNYYRTDKEGNLTDTIDASLINNFYYFSKDIVYHSSCDDDTKLPKEDNIPFNNTYKNVDLSFGSLEQEKDRYYFSIPMGKNVELRILYNWFYDHIYNRDFDEQNRNNISVCFSVVSGNNKFVSFGDLGFGESGIIRYYKDTNILKNVSCFKASHHGSTGPETEKTYTPRENTEELFKLMQPDVVIIPGVAQINRKILDDNGMVQGSQYQQFYDGLIRTAVAKKRFFDNVKAGNPKTKIYCTQIVKHLDKDGLWLMSAPFYGDIYVTINPFVVNVDCSYKGEVEGYVSGYSDKSKHFKFSNVKNGKMLSYQETEFWKAIFKNGGKI